MHTLPLPQSKSLLLIPPAYKSISLQMPSKIIEVLAGKLNQSKASGIYDLWGMFQQICQVGRYWEGVLMARCHDFLKYL